VPPADVYRLPIPDQVWERIRSEFKLPTLNQVRQRLSTLHEDPEPVMQQLVRVFLSDEGTYCPGFQFLTDLSPHPVVLGLFRRAMELKIPHNYFALWMINPCPALQGARPVDVLDSRREPELLSALDLTMVEVGG
jgi:hypothetical protein